MHTRRNWILKLLGLAGFIGSIVFPAKARALPTGEPYIRKDNGVGYDAADFGGTNGMSWAQPIGNVNTFVYHINSDLQMHVTLDLMGGTIGGNRTNSFLTVKIPEGKLAFVTAQVPCLAKDAGGNWELVYCIISEADNLLRFRRASESNWSLQTNLRLNANLVFPIYNT